MARFTITSSGIVYSVDSNGTVSTADGKQGTWSTNAENKIVAKISGSSDVKLDVEWAFNASNQLCIQNAGQILFNFTSGGIRPRYRLQENVLQVRPSGDFSFEFSLHCKWELDDKVNLKVTISKTTSVIDGWVDDKKSRFLYWFRDKQSASAPFILEFAGAWERDASVPDAVQLVFNYTAEGVKGVFKVPSKALVDAARNQVYVEYEKNGVTRRIEMRGSVEISPNLDLVFTISRQTNSAGGVVTQETKIQVATTFQFENLSGTLELYVGKTVTPTTQKLTIGGAFKVSFGDKGLNLNFAYSKSSEIGVSSTIALAINGKFTWNEGKNVLEFSYVKNGAQQTITLQSNFMLGNVRTELGLNVTKNGKQFGVYGFFGISW